MSESINVDRLIVPVYINEKIVLDMLAIMEDGFSTISQVNYTEHKESNSIQKGEAGISTSATILSKLLKINISGELNHMCYGLKNNILITIMCHKLLEVASRFLEKLYPSVKIMLKK